MDVYDPGHQNWMFDYAWPRLEPSFDHVMETARRSYPDARIVGAAIKREYPRMAATVEILNRSTPNGREEFVAIVMHCAPYFEISPGYESPTSDSMRITCDVHISEGRKAASREMKQGPSFQFEFGDDAAIRRQLDRWIGASVTFIGDNESLVMGRLRTID